MAKKPPQTKVAKIASPSLKLTEFTPSSMADVIAATGATKSAKMLMVPIDQIVEVPGYNFRITDTDDYRAKVLELKESIMAEGYYDSQPLGCFPALVDGEPKMVLISGHGRFEAAKLAVAAGADIDRLPVVLKKAGSSNVDLAVSLHKENINARPTMLEQAVLVHRLYKSGMTDTEVAERLNITERAVGDLKVLIAAPRDLRDMVKHGTISATELITRLKKDKDGGAEKVREAAAKAEEAAEKKRLAREAVGAANGATPPVRTRLTKGSIDNDGVKPPRLKLHTSGFAAKTGETFSYADAEPFLRVIGDETWFKNGRKKTERVAIEPIEVEVKIRRLPSAADEQQQQQQQAQASIADELDDPLADDEEDGIENDDDAPDLLGLGIAEPTDAEM